MSKPWKNEPTPLTDAAAIHHWNMPDGTAMKTPMVEDDLIKSHRNLERRMRAAERLLEDKRQMTLQFQDWYREADGHLEAARKEDGQ